MYIFNKFVFSFAVIHIWNLFLQSDFKAECKESDHKPDERGDEDATERS